MTSSVPPRVVGPRPWVKYVAAAKGPLSYAGLDGLSSQQRVRRGRRTASFAAKTKPTVSRRLARYRDSGGWAENLRAADLTATQLAALKQLWKARREFEREARKLESQVRFLRLHVFDARIDEEKRDELLVELRTVRQRVEEMSARLHRAYTSASVASADTATLGSRS